MSAQPPTRSARLGAVALFGVFLLVAAGILLAGILSYHHFERRLRVQVERQLSVVADLKVAEIVQWRRERMANASSLAKNPAFSSLVRQWIREPTDVAAGTWLREWLGSIGSAYDYERVILVDERGTQRMAVPESPEPADSHLLLDAPEVLRSGQVSFLDFHRETPEGPIHLVVLVPIRDGLTNAQLGVLLLRIDPERYLYPVIRRWPTPSETAETLLVRREGGNVLFLNDLRFQKGTALTLRRPLTLATLPAARAALGQEGVMEGFDYRGVAVVAAVRTVPGSPWSLVARMDNSEAYSPLRERLWQTVAFLAALLLAAGSGVALIWRQQQLRSAQDRRAAAEALLESEARLHRFYDSGLLGVIYWNMQGQITGANDRFLEMVGYTRDDLETERIDWIHMTPPEFQHLDEASVEELRATGVNKAPLEKEYIRKDGTRLPILVAGAMLDEARFNGVAFVLDQTTRRQAEDALRASQRLVEEVINTIPARVFWKDRNLRYLGCNAAFAHDAGFSHPRDIIGKDDFAMAWRDQADQYRTDDIGVIESGCSRSLVEEPQTTPDGSTITLLTSKTPLRNSKGEISGVLGTYLDITERKRAEDAQRVSERRYRRLFEAAQDGILILDAETGMIVDVNPFLVELLGFSREAFLDKKIWDLGFFKDVLANEANFFELKQKGYVRYEDMALQTSDGRRIEVEFVSNVYLVNHEKVIQCNIRDMTERHRAQVSHARLATAVEQAAETIVITDASGSIVYANPAFEKTSGYTCAEAIGNNPRMLKGGKQDDEFYRQLWTVLASGEVWTGHFINKRKDGSLFEEDATISPVRDAAGRVVNYVAVKRDVTNEMHLSQQLVQAQKMEAVGRLAGGVAHDFNNLLAVVMGYADLVLGRMDREDPLKGKVEQILKAADRAAGLTKQLLAFSRKQVLQPRILDLNVVVSNMETLLRRLIGEDVELTTRLDSGLGRVRADPGQIEQVLMNLAVNARDAMPEGGRIIIETHNAELDALYAASHPPAPVGPYVLLTVTDTGSGMDEATLIRIFEPFFSTKEVGKGTGLGLSTVYGIVKQSEGYVWVYSEVGVGTTFKIYLPRVAVHEQPPPARLESRGEIPRGHETLLLVEDEVSLRELLLETLEGHGYSVLVARDGAEALRIAEAHVGPISIMVTDVIMPGMTGPKVVELIAPTRPQMKVLYISGYSEEAVAKEGLRGPGRSFLSKPFGPEAFLRKVRESLDAS